MAKAPIAGAVKTRLVPFLSAEQAAELARALLLDQLEHLCALDSADLYLAFSPGRETALMRRLAPPRFALFPQSQGDLGARMQNIFTRLFARGHRAVVLIGADLAPVPLEYLAEAFDYLDGDKSPFHPPLIKGERAGFDGPEQRVVLGPSKDGGYYLIGLRRELPAIFENMTWSHDQVLAQTLVKLRALGIATLPLNQWFDIDRPEDLSFFESALQSWPPQAAPQTSRFLRRLKSTRKTDSMP